MKQETNYIPNKVKVISSKGLNADTKSLVLEFEKKSDFDFLPGQFVLLSLPGFGECALSVTSIKAELPQIELAVRTQGSLTQQINALRTGDEAYIRGPFGQPFPFDIIKGKELILVAGGIGLAPLRSLIKTAIENEFTTGKIRIFAGAKSPEDFIYKNELKSWQKNAEVNLSVNTCDTDWKGCIGFVTDLFQHIEVKGDSIAILCGPPVMYKPVINKLQKLGLKDHQIYVMLERRMKCGVGKCQHCTTGKKYVCLDGPTFRLDEIIESDKTLI